jgi:hypothetical protein
MIHLQTKTGDEKIEVCSPEWTWFISARKSSVAGSVTAGPALFAQLRSCHRRLPNGGRYATKYEARRYRKSLQYQSPKQP